MLEFPPSDEQEASTKKQFAMRRKGQVLNISWTSFRTKEYCRAVRN